MEIQIMEELLFETEGNTLDFKKEHYPFINSTDYQKSELLKDILAFGNAWRRTDAYILLGVEEVQGSRAQIHGISSFVDEASIQQFINSKINRPIEFRYEVVTYEEKQIVIIKIPIQKRPFFSTNDFGKVKKNTVYIRRGSATVEANPDEIIRMGTELLNSNTSPTIEMQFGNKEDQILLGQKIDLESFIIELPDRKSIPDFGSNTIDFTTNTNYYRRFAEYLVKISLVQPVAFVLYNPTPQNAVNITVRVSIEKIDGLLLFEKSPRQPSKTLPDIDMRLLHPKTNKNIEIEDLPKQWLLTFTFGNIQPKSVVWSESIYIGASEDCKFSFSSHIYADNLPNPIKTDLNINIHSHIKGKLSKSDLLKWAQR